MKFCFFGDVSNSLNGKTKGGGELQIALLAKALVLMGHQVVIIDPYNNESFLTEEGINVINVPSWNRGIKGLRLFQHRIPALYKLLRQQNADYYYCRMRSYFHIIPYLVAKRTSKKFILALASDIDVLSHREKYKFEYKANFKLFRYLSLLLPGDIVFKYLTKHANYVVLQHSGQDLNLSSIKGKKFIFSNIIDTKGLPAIPNPSREYFIYLGSLTTLKGSEKLYELVKNITAKISIVIVGQPNDKKSAVVYEKMKRLDNVVAKGRLNHNEALQLVANANALINTSSYEGFPNVFLEAWALGVPVISLKVNPGNVFDKFDLGICCKGDVFLMKQSMEKNATESFDRDKLRFYIKSYHEFTTAGNRFLDSLTNS